MQQMSPMRSAIAMVELVFAIVIMGIVLLSAPRLISVSTKSSYVAVQQEAINEAATQLNIILGYPWDEENTDENYLPPVLRVSAGNVDLDEQNGTGIGRRVGTPAQSSRSFYRVDGKDFNASAIGSDGNDSDDMDDFDGENHLVQIEATPNDYIERDTIKITTQIQYGNDDTQSGSGTYKTPLNHSITYSPDFSNAATPTSNIKFITVTLESTSAATELHKQITLHAFSANIGGYEPLERTY